MRPRFACPPISSIRSSATRACSIPCSRSSAALPARASRALRAGTPSRRARTPRSTRNLADDAARVAGGEHAVGNVACDDAARADHGPRSDAHAGQDDGAAADPNVRADRYRLAELLAPAHLGIEGMRRGVDLHG